MATSDLPIAIVWHRDDLRVDDNPALKAAVEGGYAPLPVYVHAPSEEGEWAPGAASNAWRDRSLRALDAALRARGSALHVFHGPTLPALRAIAATTGAQAVFWNRRYEPAIEARDAAIKRSLRADGLRAESFNGALLFEPWELETRSGDPYRVFTPFWKAALSHWRAPRLWDAPARLPEGPELPHGIAVDALRLVPRRGWDAGFWRHWQPGPAGARAALERFAAGALDAYATQRDFPAAQGTSRLSPHLHFGEISVQRVAARLADPALDPAAAAGFMRQLGWREFGHHLLHHFPASATHNLNPRFDRFPWSEADPGLLRAWQQGRTGVPIVDAGMRELWATGWMHNRVRMLAGSWLTKHLRLHWRHGADWFWETLVDADLANNSLGWQWVAGTGADAAPYFRIFNPATQSAKFDADGAYIARWVPELAALPPALRYQPWTDPAVARRLAPDYPARPQVDLAAGRQAALDALRS